MLLEAALSRSSMSLYRVFLYSTPLLLVLVSRLCTKYSYTVLVYGRFEDSVCGQAVAGGTIRGLIVTLGRQSVFSIASSTGRGDVGRAIRVEYCCRKGRRWSGISL